MKYFILAAAQAALTALIILVISRRRHNAPSTKQRILAKKEDNGKELSELRTARARSLSIPLCELSRPSSLCDIVGQDEGIRALKAALCGKNPQHVLIYGPPGVGKTCAARLVLEEARKNPESPFDEKSKFIEVDATCTRFDERSIADPLMGSVHDPIYQGAGAYGAQGIPQPKPGAVSRAHCGILFLDEIGELHPTQMNKLLKVLEDRKVFFESAYYSRDNQSIPAYIHDIFQNGMPADFRLVGATTRLPEEISPALRSRCVEIFFNGLSPNDLKKIVYGAVERLGCVITDEAASCCASYSGSGRDAVNILQLAGGAAHMDGRAGIRKSDIEWVAKTCRYQRRFAGCLPDSSKPGTSFGLGVSSGMAGGTVIEIECSATSVPSGTGRLDITGVIEEEEIDMRSRRIRRKSSIVSSLDNVLTAAKRRFGIDFKDYDIRFNIPGGTLVDGPSAGAAFIAAYLSAVTGRSICGKICLTGEITMHGDVRGVGGVREKAEAAAAAGAHMIIIPYENKDEPLPDTALLTRYVQDIYEIVELALGGAGIEPFTHKSGVHALGGI